MWKYFSHFCLVSLFFYKSSWNSNFFGSSEFEKSTDDSKITKFFVILYGVIMKLSDIHLCKLKVVRSLTTRCFVFWNDNEICIKCRIICEHKSQVTHAEKREDNSISIFFIFLCNQVNWDEARRRSKRQHMTKSISLLFSSDTFDKLEIWKLCSSYHKKNSN